MTYVESRPIPTTSYSIRQTLRAFCRKDRHARCSGVTITAARSALVCTCPCHAPTAG